MFRSLGLICLCFVFTRTCAAADISAFVGHYVRDASNSTDITKAIDATVANMNFVTRSVARSRLTKTNKPVPRLDINIDGTKLCITYGSSAPIVSPADGKPIHWSNSDGENAMLSAHLQGGMLVQDFQGVDGNKSNRFTQNADRTILTMETQVTSAKLPTPLIYRTVFRRAF